MKHLLTILSFLFYLHVAAQNEKLQASIKENLFNASHFSFTIIPYVVEKASICYKSGPYTLGSSAMEGIEAGANYHFNFNDKYSIIIGLHGGAAARNFELSIPKEDFNPPLQNDVEEYGALTRIFDMYLSTPVWFEWRWRHKQKNFWNLNAGANIRFYPDEFTEIYSTASMDINGQYVNVVELDLEVGRAFKPWLNYNFGGGYSYFLKNNNFFRLNFLVNLSNTSIANGIYTINVTGKEPSTGTYKSKLSYV
ncbi:MAG TPA: hypothetical protein VGD26_02720, partial [Chitinophagaceae bacterium]